MSHTSTFLDLPLEIQLLIAGYLSPPSLVSLKLSNRWLYSCIPAKFKYTKLDLCSKIAIQDYVDTAFSSPSKRVYCRLCKTQYPAELFKTGASPACFGADKHSNIITLPQHVCMWHVGKFTRVVKIDDSSTEKREAGWYTNTQHLCLHCGAVHGWQDCSCDCESCGVTEVKTYTRYVLDERDCEAFRFWRCHRGMLWARETTRADALTGWLNRAIEVDRIVHTE